MFYIEDDGEVRSLADSQAWAAWMQAHDPECLVYRTTGAGHTVSTVFTGMDLHAPHAGRPPLVYETMIFADNADSPWHMRQWRWPTRAVAQAGHRRVVEHLMASLGSEDEPLLLSSRPDPRIT